jgi:biotin carboxylase
VKKLLVAGGAHSDIPLIKAAQDLGYFVITTGNRADDKGHTFSDECVLEDFSDREAMLALVRDLKVDAICSSSNDFSIISCAYVAETLSLPGFDSFLTTLQLHHKDQFRQLAEEIGLTRVKSLIFDLSKEIKIDIADLKFPLIVKPVDLTGGKGISRVENTHQLQKAIELATSASHMSRIVIEEFFEGSLHSYSTFIKNRKVSFDYADNEFSFLNPYLVCTSTSPAKVSKFVLDQMRQQTEKLASSLNLVDGLLHAQFLAKGDDFRIIEYTRRMPGDFYSLPVTMSTGFDQARAVIEQCTGVSITTPANWHQEKFVSRHCAMATKTGVIEETEIASEISKKIIDSFDLRVPGNNITNPMVDKTAIYFLEYESAQEMDTFNHSINRLIQVKIR